MCQALLEQFMSICVNSLILTTIPLGKVIEGMFHGRGDGINDSDCHWEGTFQGGTVRNRGTRVEQLAQDLISYLT